MTEERTEYTTPDEVAARLLRMEKCIAQLENTNDGLAMIIGRHAETIKRLEADNRRLRHLDAMPVDAIRRLVEYCEWTQSEEYPVKQHIADYYAAIAHFRKMDGDA